MLIISIKDERGKNYVCIYVYNINNVYLFVKGKKSVVIQPTNFVTNKVLLLLLIISINLI